MNPEEVFVVSADEKLAWNVFFAQIVAMQLHPGFRGEPDLERCAYLADRMLLVSRKRRGEVCR